MDIRRFDVSLHDMDAVARLIYLTDKDISSLLFGKDQHSAIECIKRLMFIGDNTYSKDHVYVACAGRKVVGIMICYGGAQKRAMNDDRAFGKVSCNVRKIVLLLLGGSLNRILTQDVGDDELYISNISVDPAHRGEGIGSKLVTYAKYLCKEHKCRRLLLDVATKNTGAYRLYERMGFTPYVKRSSLLSGRNSVTGMKCEL